MYVRISETKILLINEDDTVVQFNSDSPLWDSYQSWLAQGNEPEEWNSYAVE